MKRKQIGLQCLMYAIMALILVFLLFPVYWMVVTALKTNMEAYKYPPTLAPNEPTVSSFKSLLTVNNCLRLCSIDFHLCGTGIRLCAVPFSFQMEPVDSGGPVIIPDVPGCQPYDIPVRTAWESKPD